MRIVVALGGNALLRRGEPPAAETQREHVCVAARVIAVLARDHQVVITHGNGPQIGLLAMESFAVTGAPPHPLDVLGAESQGMIGYLLETAIRNEMPGAEVVTVLGQVLVDEGDRGFDQPSKPIGPILDGARSAQLAAERGWRFIPEMGGMRRVVPSPEPRALLEAGPLRRLVESGVLVISAGGGGVPVVRGADGAFRGVEAVVDKDLTAALLAEELAADYLLLLTDVGGVFERWGEPASRVFRRARVADLRRFAFAPGSMGPKVEAACRFVEHTGGTAAIGALADGPIILAGQAGTMVRSDVEGVSFWE